MTNKIVDKLNETLGRELGRNPFGDPIFKWEWTEDLFWPSYQTGRMEEYRSPGGIILMRKQYRRDRMTFKYRNQWIVTQWHPAESLTSWETNFPGADFPVRGYRIHTDYAMRPGSLPFFEDTQFLIAQVREQKSGMSEKARYADMLAEMDREEAKSDVELQLAVGNEFTAFLNPTPGKRGGSISPQTGFGESPHLKQKKELIVHG